MQSAPGSGGTAAPGCVLASYAYTLGTAGNRLSVTELSGRSVNYGYDDLYRLTSETISGATSRNGKVGYTYDAVANRKQLNSTVAAIPSGLLNVACPEVSSRRNANDRLGTDGVACPRGKTLPTSRRRNSNGNTINNGGIANVAACPERSRRNFENHMVKHDSVAIGYDGDGNRVFESVAGVTTNYLVADSNLTGYAQVMNELQSGAVSRTYSYGLELINQRQSISGTPTTSFYGFDGHGSVRFLTSSTGAVTDTYDYDSFGNLLSSTGSTPNNYLFAGEQFDPALGIYYNRARYYDERSGRLWTMDTYEGDPESPESLHKYLYVNANPVNNTDRSGHQLSIAEANFAMAGLVAVAALSILSLPQTQKMVRDLVETATGLAGELYDELSYAAQRAYAAAELAITSAYRSVQDAIDRAKEQLKKFFRKLPKVVPMPARIIPHVADHVRSAQFSQPSLLTRVSAAQARINRNLALGWRRYVPAGPGLSWDEYPFASSRQGGFGASVRPVPADENFIQGGIIAGSYLLERISIGDDYFVVVIP